MKKLPKAFLEHLVAVLDNENTVGILLTGSFARAEAGQYSDVDIHQYLQHMPEITDDPYSLQLMNDFLVSVTLSTLEESYASLQKPQKAIWTIPGLRQSRVLLDKDGSLALLKQAAVKASWEPLQVSANMYVSHNLCGCAEEVHKILTGLRQSIESETLYAVWGLTHAMAIIMLVQHGVLVQSENVFIDLAQVAAGTASVWTRHFREAIGIGPLPAKESAYVGYGIAGLRLYRESALLFKDILLQEDAAVVDRTVKMIAEAGY